MTVDPTFLPFLDRAIALTGVERYRYLCLEHPDPAVRAGYQRLVIDIASGIDPGPRPDPAAPPAEGRPCCD